MAGVSLDQRYRPDPSVRMLYGLILAIAAAVIDPLTGNGLYAEGIILLGALALHGRNVLRLLGLLVAGAALYLPVMMAAAPGIAIRGLTVTVAIVAPASGLTPQEMSTLILRLPLPRSLKLLCEQMLLQSVVLGHETRAVHRALTVRGSLGGWRGMLVFGRTIPQVWLPRVALRAERIAVAMDLRGYVLHTPASRPLVWGRIEWMRLGTIVGIAGALVWWSRNGGW